MRASIKGGFWALVLGGTSLVLVSVLAGPPASTLATDALQTADAGTFVEDGTDEAAPAPVAATAEPAPVAVVDRPAIGPAAITPVALAELDVVLAEPVAGIRPERPRATQPPMTWLFQAGELQVASLPLSPVVVTQPAAPVPAVIAPAEESLPQVATAPLPAITEPEAEATTAVVTQTAQAPRSLPVSSAVAPAEPTPVPAEDEAVEDDTPPQDTLSEDAPAILRFSAPFENPEGLPVIAVILLDEGTLNDGPAQVFESGIVATVAVNALMEDATLWSEAYREAGAEVAMQVPLPDGATPVDVEVAFAAALEILPQAGLLYSDGTGVLRNDRLAGAQVMQILAADGRGLVTVQRGLGSLVRAAERAEVPVATVSRDIDGAGESNSAIIRGLDQAAFKARQSGGAVVVARLKPRTMDVLRNWALDAARDGILLGPVSALLVDRSALVADEGATPDSETAADDGVTTPGVSQ